MKIRIIAVGRQKPSPLRDLCDAYRKRLKSPLTLIEVDSPKAATSKIEAPLILKHLKPPHVIIALDERGASLTSPAFAEKMQTLSQNAATDEITFLIGGADGFDNSVREKADFLLSFGKQTWPHMMVRAMLLEQVYRAQQIIAGHPYHRV